jgi:hypothetical protein
MDESELRAKLLTDCERGGSLPGFDRIWGGAGANVPSAACDRRVVPEEMEFEVQFDRDGSEPFF